MIQTVVSSRERWQIIQQQLGRSWIPQSTAGIPSMATTSPIDGETIVDISTSSVEEYENIIQHAQESFVQWSHMPAPHRGEVIYNIAQEIRKNKDNFAMVISLEMGKTLAEARGEVQEVIDIADYAIGLSRTLGGHTWQSERPQHRLMEQWHPLGIVGVITAFNFPMAVWAWNAFVAWVCGNVVVWRPSPQTPLCALALQSIVEDVVLKQYSYQPISFVLIEPSIELSQKLVQDKRVAMISATGSTAMGKYVGPLVQSRFGRVLLELGGNNAVIVMEDANVELAARSIVFGAVGTSGQRCTSTRRVYAVPAILPALQKRLIELYNSLQIGDPFTAVAMGPLANHHALDLYEKSLQSAQSQGAVVLAVGGKQSTLPEKGYYVSPVLLQSHAAMPIVQQEIFAPLLHLIEVDTLENALLFNNQVEQGLSSSIFTNNLRYAEIFLSVSGSDCGIANVNVGTSGAEIGGAFGGEKASGGGREAGSDSWKAYMRRQTNTIHYGTSLPLAQGVEFRIDE